MVFFSHATLSFSLHTMQVMMSGSLSIFSSVLLLLSAFQRSVCNGPCDPLVPEYCSLPYPNSYFTMLSQETATGVKLNLSSIAFPRNTLGISVDPEKWNNFGT